VNPDDAKDPDFPYGRTFYPGVHDRASAGIISLSGGDQIRDRDIHLEEQFAPRHVTVRVTWEDGQLIKDFVFVEARGNVNTAAMAQKKQPDLKKSVVDLSVLPNESYEVDASLTCRYWDDRSIGPGAKLNSNQVHLKPGDGQTELLLIIPATSCPELPGKKSLHDGN